MQLSLLCHHHNSFLNSVRHSEIWQEVIPTSNDTSFPDVQWHLNASLLAEKTSPWLLLYSTFILFRTAGISSPGNICLTEPLSIHICHILSFVYSLFLIWPMINFFHGALHAIDNHHQPTCTWVFDMIETFSHSQMPFCEHLVEAFSGPFVSLMWFKIVFIAAFSHHKSHFSLKESKKLDNTNTLTSIPYSEYTSRRSANEKG